MISKRFVHRPRTQRPRAWCGAMIGQAGVRLYAAPPQASPRLISLHRACAVAVGQWCCTAHPPTPEGL